MRESKGKKEREKEKRHRKRHDREIDKYQDGLPKPIVDFIQSSVFYFLCYLFSRGTFGGQAYNSRTCNWVGYNTRNEQLICVVICVLCYPHNLALLFLLHGERIEAVCFSHFFFLGSTHICLQDLKHSLLRRNMEKTETSDQNSWNSRKCRVSNIYQGCHP